MRTKKKKNMSRQATPLHGDSALKCACDVHFLLCNAFFVAVKCAINIYRGDSNFRHPNKGFALIIVHYSLIFKS
jgi:hypothetical protein